MRLHRLEVAAFGPFPGTVRVDFDDLSQAGLFLLTGPTGSGKTSVLDAVCFALYGDVPGDRAQARQLRSDHAAAGAVPRVQLDCTIAGRRFRIVRQPAWQRPKKRGHGTTGEQARVSLSELRSGDWGPVSNRMDEVGHLMTGLLGMTLTQFTQVALLPQGDFQAFLRAGADSRQKLLERLFRTARFREIEAWLADRRRVLGRANQQHAQEASTVLARVAEVTGNEVPASWDDTGLVEAIEDGELTQWLRNRLEACHLAATDGRRCLESAKAGSDRAAEELRAGRDVSEQQHRRARAAADQERQRGQAAPHEARRTRLEAAAAAGPVLALLTAEDAARTQAENAEAAARSARAAAESALASLPPVTKAATGIAISTDADPFDFDAARLRATRLATRLRDAKPREVRRCELRRHQDHDRNRAEQLKAEVTQLTERGSRLPELLVDARARLRDATTAHAELPGHAQATSNITTRLAAAQRAVALHREHGAAVSERQAAVEEVQVLTEAWLEVRERRLSGMAAEIATQLAVGCECPVCGSQEHPAPARPGQDSPDAEVERSARRRVDDAEVVRESVADRERGLAQALAVARETAGGASVDELAQVLATAKAMESATREIADTLPATQGEVDRLDADLQSHHERVADHQREIDAVAVAVADRERQLAEIDLVLAAVRGGVAGDLESLAAYADAAAAACSRARSLIVECERASKALAEAEERTRSAAHRAGFADTAAARAAALSPAEQHQLARAVRAHDDHVAAVQAVLRDPDLVAASRAPAPDLEGLTTAAADSASSLASATHADRSAAQRLARTSELESRLTERLAAWGPVRAQHALVSQLAAFAEGKSVDNQQQMRLSAYVLAFRLGQVVDAANERLAGMSDQRYLLEHTSARSAGDRRGGLGLMVRDAWSGTTRDPATLSGGETFIVSLALALGLADVVAHESGGAQLDTLFVDEGFGSLDPETLEDVMETLDGLRSGGRVVGVVSHVSEMRDRIPAKLVLHKSPSGSTLTQVNA